MPPQRTELLNAGQENSRGHMSSLSLPHKHTFLSAGPLRKAVKMVSGSGERGANAGHVREDPSEVRRARQGGAGPQPRPLCLGKHRTMLAARRAQVTRGDAGRGQEWAG